MEASLLIRTPSSGHSSPTGSDIPAPSALGRKEIENKLFGAHTPPPQGLFGANPALAEQRLLADNLPAERRVLVDIRVSSKDDCAKYKVYLFIVLLLTLPVGAFMYALHVL